MLAVLAACGTFMNLFTYYILESSEYLFIQYLLPVIFVNLWFVWRSSTPCRHVMAVVVTGTIALMATTVYAKSSYHVGALFSIVFSIALSQIFSKPKTAMIVSLCIQSILVATYFIFEHIVQTPLALQSVLVTFVGTCGTIIVLYYYTTAFMQQRSLLEQTIKLVNIGLVTFDVPTNKITLDNNAVKMIGYTGDPNDFSAEDFKASIHPDDLQMYEDAVYDASHEPLVVRIKNTDGEYRYIKGKRFRMSDSTSVSLLQDVTEYELDKLNQHNTVEQLEIALKELENKNREQSRLYSVVAHELRTPAASLQMILSEYFDDRSIRLTSDALGLVKHLLEVLDDMRLVMEPTTIRKNKMSASPIFPLVYAAQTSVHAFNSEKHINLEFDGNLISYQTFNVDTRLIKQVSLNLVKNAIVHSGCKNIFVYVAGEEDRYIGDYVFTVDVRDDGKGITEHTASQMFDPFYQGDKNAPGSGLGLYICKQIAQNLGGDLKYTRLPKGSKFTFTFRANPATEDAPQSAMENTEVKNLVKYDLKGKKVLFAEDDKTLTMLTTAILKKQGVEVIHAGDGFEAIEKFHEGTFDFILTDYHMPKMNGDKLTQVIRDAGFDLPIIALTAATIGKETDHLLEAGCTAVMGKPINIDELVKILSENKG